MYQNRVYHVTQGDGAWWEVRVDDLDEPAQMFASKKEALDWCRQESRSLNEPNFLLETDEHVYDNGEPDFGDGTGFFDSSLKEES